MSLFTSLPLIVPLQSALKRLEFTTMTPIQEQALPIILKGGDVIAQASTGSGKTLAFALGILQNINPKFFAAQALILCPTRELAEQVAKVIRSCASDIGNIKLLTLCGGVPMKAQRHSLSHGAHIIVGTPGRVLKLLQIDALDLTHCKTAVLDEADQMVDMGFIEDMEAIFGYLPSSKQALLFSATYPDSIEQLTKKLTQNGEFIQSSSPHAKPKINEIAYIALDKTQALHSLIANGTLTNAIIFCNTKVAASELHETLNYAGIHAITLHGDMEQFDRNEAIIQFRNGSAPFLVATDVAGRGIDIAELDAVVNYDVPQQLDRYIHRIGRTGRAGLDGTAITLVSSHQMDAFKALERGIEIQDLPRGHNTAAITPTLMQTLCIDGGKKDKLRAGDIVGALIHEGGLTKDQIGKIDQQDHLTYVAIERYIADATHKKLQKRPIKGKTFRIWLLE
jgi:ATP-independent RNA helicase DbpA